MQKLVEELRVEETAAYKEMLRMNYETFEEIWNTIGPVITKIADRKTLIQLSYAWSNEKNYHRLS